MKNEPLVKNIAEIELVLTNINWNFDPKPLIPSERSKPFDCRKYHWYPATFIPEIPFTLIELLTKPNAKVFDPFLGIGTTYFQALILNRLPIGVDSNLVSIEYTRLLVELFNPEIDLKDQFKLIQSSVLKYDPLKKYTKSLKNRTNNIFLKELEKWYSDENYNALCFLMLFEKGNINSIMSAAIRISILKILNTISNQDRGWGCIADNVLPKVNQIKKVNVISLFLNTLKSLSIEIENIKNCKDLNISQVFKKISNSSTLFHTSILEFDDLPDASVDLILTSPPYPNMVDYTTSQRLSYYYLGYDLNQDKINEIGARHKRNHESSLSNYLAKMQQVNQVLTRMLKKGGYLCYIMPLFDSDNYNNHQRRSIMQKVIEDLENNNLKKEIELHRTIPSLRRSHNAKWASLKNEIIFVFKK